MKRYGLLLVLLAALAALSACGEGGEEPAPEEPEATVLTYAILNPETVTTESISSFNRAHKDVQIEVRNYARLSENGKSGVDLLMVELATGQVPDIIDLGSTGQLCQLSYRELAKKGFLEDLWPYIENDPDIGREGVVEAFLKPAEVNGGLYTVYNAIKVHTLVGPESVVGRRTSWTMDEMLETFASLPGGELLMDNVEGWSTVPDSMKRHLLSSITSGFINLFIDQETGQCSFDGQAFRDLLAFINTIPDTPEEYAWMAECLDHDDMYATHVYRMQSGQVMLLLESMQDIIKIRIDRTYFGEGVTPVGYPLGDGIVGSYYEPCNNRLAISSTCKDKEAAWEYVRQMFFGKTARDAYHLGGIPVSRPMYHYVLGTWKKNDRFFTPIGGNDVPIAAAADDELDWWEAYFDSITHCSLFLEPAVLAFIDEAAAAYFAGDLTLDQAVGRIQSRAMLYMQERL